jgi:hypothetical protein
MVPSDGEDDPDSMDVIEDRIEPDVPYGTEYTLYIPDFVPQHVHDNMTESEMVASHDIFLKKDWLTPGLTAEIHRHFPQNEDICAESGQRSMESFKEHCLQLFPEHRVFASSRQISQAAKEFCDAWGISSTCQGKKIVCYYGKGPTRKPREQLSVGAIRVPAPSLKSQECPFEI